jgi:hypothetical protein
MLSREIDPQHWRDRADLVKAMLDLVEKAAWPSLIAHHDGPYPSRAGP